MNVRKRTEESTGDGGLKQWPALADNPFSHFITKWLVIPRTILKLENLAHTDHDTE